MTGEAGHREALFGALVEVLADVARTVEAADAHLKSNLAADTKTVDALNHIMVRVREALSLSAVASLRADDLERVTTPVEND